MYGLRVISVLKIKTSSLTIFCDKLKKCIKAKFWEIFIHTKKYFLLTNTYINVRYIQIIHNNNHISLMSRENETELSQSVIPFCNFRKLTQNIN